jgi:hypothetical protein
MSIMQAIQGTLLAWGVDFSLEADKKEIHEIHGAEKSWVGFKLHAEYLDDWPDIVTDCGWLVGMDLPKKGPMEGKEVKFNFDEVLQEHGKPGFTTKQTTDSSGNAYMDYIPNKEDPLGSTSNLNVGCVGARPRVQDWLNLPSKMAEMLIPNDKFVCITVTWHDPTDEDYKKAGRKPGGTREQRSFGDKVGDFLDDWFQ